MNHMPLDFSRLVIDIYGKKLIKGTKASCLQSIPQSPGMLIRYCFARYSREVTSAVRSSHMRSSPNPRPA